MLISIIMPAYNAVNFITGAVNSVLDQTYNEWELLIVDDGSTDGTEKLKFDDNRIKIFHQENQGQSVARNVGLEQATGEYIAFIDADDAWHPLFLQTMVEYINQGCDLVQCEFTSGNAPHHWVESQKFANESLIKQDVRFFTGQEYLRQYFNPELPGIGGVLWNKVFKATLFEDIRFPEGRIHEDVAVLYKLEYKAKWVACVPMILYYYFLSDDSTMRSRFSMKRLDWATAFEEKLDFLAKNQEIALYNRSLQEYEAVLLKLYYGMKRYFPKERHIIDELLIKIQSNYSELKEKDEIGTAAKVLFGLAQIIPFHVGWVIDKKI